MHIYLARAEKPLVIRVLKASLATLRPGETNYITIKNILRKLKAKL